MQSTYRDIVITYNEDTDKWEFTLRNRERECNSLKEAKGIIDKPVRETNENPFEPVEGWLVHTWREDKPIPGRVTSLAAPSRYGSTQQVRFVADGKKAASHESIDMFVPASEHNAALLEALEDAQRQKDHIEDVIAGIKKKFTKIKV